MTRNYNNNQLIESSSEEIFYDEEKFDDAELEKDFFTDNKKNGRFIVICGKTGSGKSWLATNYIAISYFYNTYDEYIFVLPEYETDANAETYKFIEGHKNTTIYDSYSSEITTKVKTQSKTKKILYVLDDATNYLFDNKNKAELLKMSTTCRHGKGITIIIISHALKNILVPAIRAMIHYLFIGAFTNANMIEKQLWEENCSIMIRKDEFLNEYKQNIINDNNNFLFINMKCKLSFHVNNWNLSIFDRNKSLSHESKIKYIKIDKNYKIKQKIKDKNEVKKLESVFGWKEEKKTSENVAIKFKKYHKTK